MDIEVTLFATKGAAAAVATRLGISQAAVSQWRDRGIPASRVPEVEAVLREHLQRLGVLPEASNA